MQNKSYSLAVFDMDGTILDSLADLMNGVNYALEQFGYPTHQIDEYRYFVGNGARMLVYRSLPEKVRENEEEVNRVLKVYRDYYCTHNNILTGPYADMLDVLYELKQAGVKLGIVSNKPDPDTKALAEFYFPGIFDIVFGARPDIPIKPDPSAVLEIMQLLNIAPSDTAYFGDTWVDVETGHSAGAYTVGVLWGFRTKKELEEAGADVIIEKVTDIATIVLGKD